MNAQDATMVASELQRREGSFGSQDTDGEGREGDNASNEVSGRTKRQATGVEEGATKRRHAGLFIVEGERERERRGGEGGGR